MAALIGTVLLLVLSYYAYRAAVSTLEEERAHDPRLPAQRPDTASEAREHELSCQLLDGRIEPAAHQREMTELARRDQARHGDPR